MTTLLSNGRLKSERSARINIYGRANENAQSLTQQGIARAPLRARGPFYLQGLCLYTSRMASMTTFGSSNSTYSELWRGNICFAFDDRVSQRASAIAI